jgi:tRNA nucleotidyltransferase (CCA-adding enzyme)
MKPFPQIPNAELYLCGGCVRDSLLGKEFKDRDFVIVTSMTFDETVKVIESMPNAKVFLAKPEFFTIRCIIDGEPIDIAFPRDENSYSDGRHPDNVKRVDTLLEDAKRRDFTINAMYMMDDGTVLDFFHGQQDLTDGIICCVGDANDRFKEDGLRILRAIRFSITLKTSDNHSFKFDGRTLDAMNKNTELLNGISADRIKDELNKPLLINPRMTQYLINKFDLYDVLEVKGLTFELTSRER